MKKGLFIVFFSIFFGNYCNAGLNPGQIEKFINFIYQDHFGALMFFVGVLPSEDFEDLTVNQKAEILQVNHCLDEGCPLDHYKITEKMIRENPILKEEIKLTLLGTTLEIFKYLLGESSWLDGQFSQEEEPYKTEKFNIVMSQVFCYLILSMTMIEKLDLNCELNAKKSELFKQANLIFTNKTFSIFFSCLCSFLLTDPQEYLQMSYFSHFLSKTFLMILTDLHSQKITRPTHSPFQFATLITRNPLFNPIKFPEELGTFIIKQKAREMFENSWKTISFAKTHNAPSELSSPPTTPLSSYGYPSTPSSMKSGRSSRSGRSEKPKPQIDIDEFRKNGPNGPCLIGFTDDSKESLKIGRSRSS